MANTYNTLGKYVLFNVSGEWTRTQVQDIKYAPGNTELFTANLKSDGTLVEVKVNKETGTTDPIVKSTIRATVKDAWGACPEL